MNDYLFFFVFTFFTKQIKKSLSAVLSANFQKKIVLLLAFIDATTKRFYTTRLFTLTVQVNLIKTGWSELKTIHSRQKLCNIRLLYVEVDGERDTEIFSWRNRVLSHLYRERFLMNRFTDCESVVIHDKI
jgi:hypothetical protein